MGDRHRLAIIIKTIFSHVNQLRPGSVWPTKGMFYRILRLVLPDTGSVLQKMPDCEPNTLVFAEDTDVEIRLSPAPEFCK